MTKDSTGRKEDESEGNDKDVHWYGKRGNFFLRIKIIGDSGREGHQIADTAPHPGNGRFLVNCGPRPAPVMDFSG